MKTAIVYHSSHHGNTKKVAEAIARGRDVTLIDAAAAESADLTDYELIGFASGIYFGKFHKDVLEFAKNNLPKGKKVFFLSTYGGSSSTKAIEEAILDQSPKIVGQFGCKGYDTFGPFRLIGGICRGRPNEADLKDACDFFEGLQ